MPNSNEKSLNAAASTFTGASSGYSSSSANPSSSSPYANLNAYESHTTNASTNPSGYSSYVTGGGGTSSGTSSGTGVGVGAGGITATNSYDTYATADHSSSGIYMNSSSAHGHNFDLAKTDKLSSPLVHDDALAQEVLSKAGPAYTYQRKDYSHDIGSLQTNADGTTNATSGGNTSSYQDYDNSNDYNLKSSYDSAYGVDQSNVINIESSQNLFSASSIINQDPDPIRIVKPNTQNIVYKQQVNIRYLQPPTPPPPAPIIIREKQIAPPPSQPPIIIRQTAPAPPTPPPLTIREKAPTPPPVLEPTIIERPVPPPPAPPRQVIIERVPAPPAKPRPIIYEKWLPYKSIKRPVIVQKVKQTQPQAPPKNVIIEYEKPKAVAIRQVIEEGIFRVDPATYQTAESSGEIRFVDRITDLPIENSRILSQLNLESSTGNTNDANLSSIYAQYLNPANNTSSSSNNQNSSSQSSSHHQSNLNSAISVPSLIDSKYYSSSSNQYSYTSQNNIEYETITTSVPETLAAKIIAEAQAAGAITRLANC